MLPRNIKAEEMWLSKTIVTISEPGGIHPEGINMGFSPISIQEKLCSGGFRLHPSVFRLAGGFTLLPASPGPVSVLLT